MRLFLEIESPFLYTGTNRFRIIDHGGTNISRSFYVLWRTYLSQMVPDMEQPSFDLASGMITMDGCESFGTDDLVCLFQDFLLAKFTVREIG